MNEEILNYNFASSIFYLTILVSLVVALGFGIKAMKKNNYNTSDIFIIIFIVLIVLSWPFLYFSNEIIEITTMPQTYILEHQKCMK